MSTNGHSMLCGSFLIVYVFKGLFQHCQSVCFVFQSEGQQSVSFVFLFVFCWGLRLGLGLNLRVIIRVELTKLKTNPTYNIIQIPTWEPTPTLI